ncbi:PREDICTED: uncharacterized protein LOC109469219 isoform X2 [Branchiostoma belcheri]|nr:PREDICTED: uncharacterized protein LOC109469219 isoform X2 [Branchiostoma belcheri]XP_019623237.1 PREDICTED: uncharacterized protein LOC109469219 isoform X2 [Branchiostoma belcheri]XP_019623238.1 PREDICTED: uncharacterized protein LOC109469219 isoform X2 [Branchiostoma belcheri]XP_019623239.1 PREDICTED: uncharacterized protein LOC109469219 isoform X2 [Branchiostoma belcheri]
MATTWQQSEEKAELTGDVVASVRNLREAIKVANKYGISLGGAKTLEQVKERLQQHVSDKTTTKEDFEILAVVADLKDDDSRKRQLLQVHIKEMREFMRDCDKSIEAHLRIEQTVTDAETDFASRLEQLESDCPILVAGETSSGKSSLINLLLGEDLLPSAHLSSTSVICKIRYGEKKRAVINYADGRQETLSVPEGGDAGTFTSLLHTHLHKKSDREKRSQYRDVEIFFPLKFLKSGIFIVDGPGIGENQTMDGVLLDYLPNAFAFIYVIKSDNAGGVQKDRLQQLLKTVAKRTKLQSVNPAAAMFVCNRWDLVDEGEREKVRRDTVQKLKTCWPGFRETQLFCMDSKSELENSKHGHKSRDFENLLYGIRNLIPCSLQAKIRASSRWLEYVVGRVLHHVKTYLYKSKMTSLKLKEVFQKTRQDLEEIKDEADKTISSLQKEVEQSITREADRLKTYLASPDAEEAMKGWRKTVIPDVTEGVEWDVVMYEMETCINNRMEKVVEEWGEEKGYIGSEMDRLMQELMTKVFPHQLRLKQIEEEIEVIGKSGSNQSEIVRRISMARYFRTFNQGEAESTSRKTRDRKDSTNIDLTSSFLALGIVGAVAAGPVLAFYGVQSLRKKYKDKKEKDKYVEDGPKYVEKKAVEALKAFSQNDEGIRKYVEESYKPIRDRMESFQTSLQKQMKAQLELMTKIEDDRRSKLQLDSDYTPMLKTMEEMQAKLELFNLQELPLVHPDAVCCQSTDETVVSNTVFAVSVKGFMEGKEVIIKKYHGAIDVESARDIGRMRNIRHPNILAFKGVDFSSCAPRLVLETADKTLRQVVPAGAVHCGKGGFVFRQTILYAIKGICNALSYLHENNLVSFELSQDTVQVVGDTEFKLLHVGVPRKVKLPPDVDTKGSAFVYLPPETLQGDHVYDSRSDMYSLGLVMWELWYHQKAFEDMTHLPLETFLRDQYNRRPNTSDPGPSNGMSGEVGKKWRGMIDRCLVMAREKRDVLPSDIINDLDSF